MASCRYVEQRSLANTQLSSASGGVIGNSTRNASSDAETEVMIIAGCMSGDTYNRCDSYIL